MFTVLPVLLTWLLLAVSLILTWLAGDRYWRLHELTHNLEGKKKQAYRDYQLIKEYTEGVIGLPDSMPKTFPLRDLPNELQREVAREIHKARNNGS